MRPDSVGDARTKLQSEALVAMLVAAGHLARELEAVCQEEGITHDQYNVLRILRGAPSEGHPRGEIASRMINRAPDVTRMIDRLERTGLVARGWHPDNRRLSMTTITKEGRALLARVDALVIRVQSKFAADLNRDELSELRRLCRSLHV